MPPTLHTTSGTPPAVPELSKTWLLTELLASGAWSEVYRARPRQQEEDSALYVLKVAKSGPQLETAKALIQREALVGQQTASPYLISVLSSSIARSLPYVVLPLLDGTDLQRHLNEHANFPVSQTLWIARQICEGLRDLHQRGWLHCDVKPANIMWSPDGHATLIDLGMAKRKDRNEGRSEAIFAGTMAYTAPELLQPHVAASPACDVFGLGVTLFEMLTGRLPVQVDDPQKIAVAMREERVTRLRSLKPTVPRHVAALIECMIAKEPLRRPTVDELISEFSRMEIELFDFDWNCA